MLPKEVTYIVKRFLGSVQESDVGGEDVDHALPGVDLDSPTLAFDAFAVSKRVVEENLVFTIPVLNNLFRPVFHSPTH